MKSFRIFNLLSILFLLTACGSPKEEFTDFIVDKNYIPYKTPIDEAGVGTIVKGNAHNMRLAARPDRCMPDQLNGKNTFLRWAAETDLPSEYHSFEVGFKADLSPLTAYANPLLRFNFDYGRAKYVSIKFEGASIEYLDEIAFGAFYKNNMSDECIEFVENFPFIVQALRIEKMKFEFKSSNQSSIYVNPGNISDIVNIGIGVDWNIQNGKELVINTPKFIGYQVGRLRPEDNGMIRLYASKVDKKGNFKFESAGDNFNGQKLKPKSSIIPMQMHNSKMKSKYSIKKATKKKRKSRRKRSRFGPYNYRR